MESMIDRFFIFAVVVSEWLYLNFKSWKWRVGKNFSSILLLFFFFLSTRQIKNFWILKNHCCCKECEKFVVDSFFLLLVRATIYTRDGDFFLNFRNLVLYCGEMCCEWRVKNLSLIFFLLLLWLLWEIWEICLNFTMLFELWNIIHRFFFLLLYDFFIFIKRLVFIVEFVTNMKNESRKLSIEERKKLPKNCKTLKMILICCLRIKKGKNFWFNVIWKYIEIKINDNSWISKIFDTLCINEIIDNIWRKEGNYRIHRIQLETIGN